jgi:hypothetical protein
MTFTHKIDEELDKIFIYDENGCRVGFGSLMEDGVDCKLFACDYLHKERKKYQETSLKYAQFQSDKYKKSVEDLHKEYFKSLEKLEKFEQKVIELKKTYKKTKSPREILMDKAKKMFPVGTKFTSIFGADDEIVDREETFGTKRPIHYWDDDKECILAHCKRESRMIYDGRRWADVHK